ncbi:MAG: PQQ-binding-like beta-propeller repeat protein, partial [Acidimicrobiia bacterium]|nr:PQQ-binding-like beta-propeller repeat protein [Acidimicrobiia bacterium]
NSGRNVSIESSLVAFERRVYFANSGGRVVGVDVSRVWEGEAPIVFDYYAGGDIDATPAIDADGMLYVAIEHEPAEMSSVEKARNLEVGQLVKLDPYTDGDPRVWGVDLTEAVGDSGSWASPALHQGHVYTNTHAGSLIAVDGDTGEIVWSDEVGFHSWSSPSVIGGILVTATCLGDVRAYSLDDPAKPIKLWSLAIGGGACLESTPAIWNGRIYIGSRDGFMRALG